MTISVVIPARDEAGRIGPLLELIVGAPGVQEVIVVDDQSSDGTAEVAARRGARVVAGEPLPDGWAGKAWALQQGFLAATTDWVVTLDADTRPDPLLPTALVARARADGLDLVTVAGRFDCPTAPSRWLHAAMLTSLVYRFGPPGWAGPPGTCDGQRSVHGRPAPGVPRSRRNVARRRGGRRGRRPRPIARGDGARSGSSMRATS